MVAVAIGGATGVVIAVTGTHREVKVYIAVENGYEHTTILGVCASRKTAERIAHDKQIEINKDWQDLRGPGSKYYDRVSFENGPHDKTTVWEYELR